MRKNIRGKNKNKGINIRMKARRKSRGGGRKIPKTRRGRDIKLQEQMEWNF